MKISVFVENDKFAVFIRALCSFGYLLHYGSPSHTGKSQAVKQITQNLKGLQAPDWR